MTFGGSGTTGVWSGSLDSRTTWNLSRERKGTFETGSLSPPYGPDNRQSVAAAPGSALFSRNGLLPPDFAGDLRLDFFPVFGVDPRREVLPAGVCEEAHDVAAVELAGQFVGRRGHGA